MVTLTARKLADLRSLPYETLHEHLNLNTQRFFNLKAL
jgi:Tat protein secretion system quality control protein TatD with DNase activity